MKSSPSSGISEPKSGAQSSDCYTSHCYIITIPTASECAVFNKYSPNFGSEHDSSRLFLYLACVCVRVFFYIITLLELGSQWFVFASACDLAPTGVSLPKAQAAGCRSGSPNWSAAEWSERICVQCCCVLLSKSSSSGKRVHWIKHGRLI